jgi:hypothetical protein
MAAAQARATAVIEKAEIRFFMIHPLGHGAASLDLPDEGTGDGRSQRQD